MKRILVLLTVFLLAACSKPAKETTPGASDEARPAGGERDAQKTPPPAGGPVDSKEPSVSDGEEDRKKDSGVKGETKVDEKVTRPKPPPPSKVNTGHKHDGQGTEDL